MSEAPTLRVIRLAAGNARIAVSGRNALLTYPGGATYGGTGLTSGRQLELARGVLAASHGLAPRGSVALTSQIHGTACVYRRNADGTPLADAQWTDRPRLALGVLVADCCPVVIAGEGIVGIAHAGWRGAAGGVVGSLLSAMGEAGLKPQFAEAWIGPCADGDRYEVGPEVAAQFSAWPAAIAPAGRGDRSVLSLQSVILTQLREAGLAEQAIVVDRRGTISNRLFHSHRRDGSRSGRSIVLAWLDPTA